MFDARARCCGFRHRGSLRLRARVLGFAASRVRSDGPLERIDVWDDGAVREGFLRGASCHKRHGYAKAEPTGQIASVLQAARSVFLTPLFYGPFNYQGSTGPNIGDLLMPTGRSESSPDSRLARL